MAWAITGYPMTAGAPVQDAVQLTENVATTSIGQSIMISASATAVVTLTLASGNTIVVNPQVGDNIYPFAVSKATKTSGTITGYYNLFATS